MERCIYCLRTGPEAQFIGTEHVVPQAFGRFDGNPTLNGCVCDGCNADFSENLDLYLARDTPEGLLRFAFKVKDAGESRHHGRRATMTSRVDRGRLAGALLWYQEYERALHPFHAPQIGFGKTIDGPFKWSMRDAMPSKEDLRENFPGRGAVEMLGLGHGEDNKAEFAKVMDELRALGASFEGEPQSTMTLGLQPKPERVEHVANLGPLFWRCIAKISMNYVAFIAGPEPLYGAAFDPIRSFIVDGTPDARLTQWIGNGPLEPTPKPGTAYKIGFKRFGSHLAVKAQ